MLCGLEFLQEPVSISSTRPVLKEGRMSLSQPMNLEERQGWR